MGKNFHFRTLYRITYVAAIFTGVFAVFAWVVGWSNDWIQLDIEVGELTRSVLGSMEALDDAMVNVLRTLRLTINALSFCRNQSMDCQVCMLE